ncbi:uncharacterized protein BDW43DRAFT_295680 [Aspergillus alliaceus]|uniref:uncharacterized protein n=1 Tax=Petromyces alliaceus TaxID=209559 RepID=UPI0012A5BE8E|nr:uncharacterized protein BDW43DRAFT_295680 [Aspergillus alliaceus]KAB8226815.1 hypothetical protein BDW43DRAFT_295680 [Aspergillus alliaceus]
MIITGKIADSPVFQFYSTVSMWMLTFTVFPTVAVPLCFSSLLLPFLSAYLAVPRPLRRFVCRTWQHPHSWD